MGISIDDKEMQSFFEELDMFDHKFLFGGKCTDKRVKRELTEHFCRANTKRLWDMEKATETYRTIDKVYHLEPENNIRDGKLIQLAAEKFLGEYVNIDGIEALFRSSYFYFEWMMHLEYMDDKHDYSYYRDHYVHQIRNLYEMFVFLDKMDFWTRCVGLYASKGNITAKWLKNTVNRQTSGLDGIDQSLLLRTGNQLDEIYWHYVIFATAIVSALVHDIGYPIVFMKRTMEKMRNFLPASHLFMRLEDAIPRIRNLLEGSLLFQAVDGKEIEKRLAENDHGAYSAIMLLYQYYDNGRIFSLEPVKQAVIELSALVIYNHTLRYEYQGAYKADRFRNEYDQNPLSYLFRLCDDLQEWKRVYFEISSVSNFFVCGRCRMPLIRGLGLKEGEAKIYTCFCGQEGINTNQFAYRRLLNVSAFDKIIINWNAEDNCMEIALKSCLRSLLQIAKYNPNFAWMRLKGIQEIKRMVECQNNFPRVYVDTFISVNPIAIKMEILRRYIEPNKSEEEGSLLKKLCAGVRWNGTIGGDLKEDEWEEISAAVKRKIQMQKWGRKIKNSFLNQLRDDNSGFRQDRNAIFSDSLEFYLFLAVAGELLKKGERDELDSCGKELPQLLDDAFYKLAVIIANQWNICRQADIILISDCLMQSFCDVTKEDFCKAEYDSLYFYRFSSRLDLADIIKAYTNCDGYRAICQEKTRKTHRLGNVYDYYSDYYFYFKMDEMVD